MESEAKKIGQSVDFFQNREFCLSSRKKFVRDRSLYKVNEDLEQIYDALGEQKATVSKEV